MAFPELTTPTKVALASGKPGTSANLVVLGVFLAER